MRLLTLTVILAAAGVAAAAEPDRRVRVALALAACDGERCGLCLTDLDAAKAAAVKDGKPLLIWVGCCPCESQRDALRESVVYCRLDSYDRDGRPAEEKRLIVNTPDAGRCLIRATLPANATGDAIRTAFAPLPTPVTIHPPPVQSAPWVYQDCPTCRASR